MYHIHFKIWKASEKLTAAAAGVLALLTVLLRTLPGVSFSANLCFLGVLACLVLLTLSRWGSRRRGWKILLRAAQAGLAVLILGLAAVEIWVIRVGSRNDFDQPADAVIVLGAGEDISEARAMYDALTARGIDPERLILEEQSANTRQNLENSLALLPDSYHKTVAIVTNDFHMARVQLLLSADGPGRVVQVPAKLPWWLSVNYYLRESFAVVNDLVVRPLLA